MTDLVNRPPHYNQGEIECIDAMRSTCTPEVFSEYCRLQAFRYIWRANDKENRDRDILKAIWYLRMSRGDDPRK